MDEAEETALHLLRTAIAPFTVADAFLIRDLVDAVNLNRRVTFSTDGGVTVQDGTVRRIGEDQTGNNLPGIDIRDQFVWITTRAGMEVFIPVPKIMEMTRDLLFVLADSPTR